MNIDEAQRLLALSRNLPWSFPSSSGNPVRKAEDLNPAIVELADHQEGLEEAARLLIANGNVDSAVELAANTWRLWIVNREDYRRKEISGCSAR